MWRYFLGLIFFLVAMGSVSAQSLAEGPSHVTTCELENHPKVYDGQLVEVTGQVSFGKFDFYIDSSCKPHGGAGVWLDIGGDVESPQAYWGIGDYFPKRKGSDVRVEGVPIPLVHDALLDRFVNDIGATRFRKPNGEGCGSECLFYDVTATVQGRFFSGARHAFGLNGCCHLLVVQRVLNVASKRTSVPAGGEFECKSDRWQPTPEELKALSAIPSCSLRDDFAKCDAQVAKQHWHEIIDPKDNVNDGRHWMSRDMTLSYIFDGGFIQNPGGPIEMKPSGSFIRQSCRAVVPPKPFADHVYIRFYSAGPEDPREIAVQQTEADRGDQAWRASDADAVAWSAFQKATKEWNLESTARIKPSKCEVNPPDTDQMQQWGNCEWFSPDDMQEVTVEVHKRAAQELVKAVWVVTSIKAGLCQTAHEH